MAERDTQNTHWRIRFAQDARNIISIVHPHVSSSQALSATPADASRSGGLVESVCTVEFE